VEEVLLQDRLAQLVDTELLYQRGRPPRAKYIFNPSCHLLKPWAFSSKLRVKHPFHPPEEQAHGRQNYSDVLPV